MADIHPSDCQANAGEGSVPVASSDTVGSKRQRRPSVRLGDQPHDSHTRRQSSSAAASVPKQWKHPSHHHSLNPSAAAAIGKSSKTRVITNLSTEFNAKNQTPNDAKEANNNTNNLDGVAIGSWRVKDSKKRGPATKRVRSNWVSNSNVETEEKHSGGEDTDDFDRENSESPLREQSHHIHSLDNLGINGKERHDFYHGNNQRCEEDGVRTWLESLGLGRYAPVFEIHEVDEEILPLLTLEDLKDMGINAVGSRRKLFNAIQRLGKGFS